MAIKFEKIVPGMILYDVHSHRMGNTSMRSLGVWPVEVIKVDAIRRRALVRWNNNSPEWRSERYLVKLRAKCPEMLTDSAGCQRLKRRGEKGAHSPSGISRSQSKPNRMEVEKKDRDLWFERLRKVLQDIPEHASLVVTNAGEVRLFRRNSFLGLIERHATFERVRGTGSVL